MLRRCHVQKWEYLVVYYTVEREKGRILIKYLNFQEIRDWKQAGFTVQAYLNKLGEDGWELVHDQIGGDKSGGALTLKRPKP